MGYEEIFLRYLQGLINDVISVELSLQVQEEFKV